MKQPSISILDLLSQEFAFTQNLLITTDGFVRMCEARGVNLWPGQVEALRRAGVLAPLFRYEPSIQRSPKKNQKTRPFRLSSASANRVAGVGRVGNTQFLYSPYQLLLLPLLRQVLPKIHARRSSSGSVEFTLRIGAPQRAQIQTALAENDRLVVALTALEAIYRPAVLGTVRLRPSATWEDWIEFRNAFDPREMLEWLDCDPEWVLDTARRLLHTADSIDPLRNWYDLVRLMRPRQWERLCGDALIAIDHRIAAEILLRFYEDLAQVGTAQPLPSPLPILPFVYDPLRCRLHTSRDDLDAILTNYGLSPHPSLVLVVEGDTEHLVVPRVMELLGVANRPDFIKVVKAGTVTRDFGFLASYVALPSLGEAVGDYVVLTRPATRFLVVVDPEGEFATPEQADKSRRRWVNQIFERLSHERQTQVVRQELDKLVIVDTWGDEAFEFAHFDDRELAEAIFAVYPGRCPMPLSRLTECVGSVRRAKRNLETLWVNGKWPKPHPSKVALAEHLWPALEQKVLRVLDCGSPETVPVVRVLLRAFDLATEFQRHGIAMRLSDERDSA